MRLKRPANQTSPKQTPSVALRASSAPTQMLRTGRRLLPVKAAANILGCSVWTVRAWCYSGAISSHKIGAKLLVAEDEVERVIAESERPRLVSA